MSIKSKLKMYNVARKPACFTYRFYEEGGDFIYLNSAEELEKLFRNSIGIVSIDRINMFDPRKPEVYHGISQIVSIVAGQKDGNLMFITHGESELNQTDAFEINTDHLGKYLQRLEDGKAPSKIYENEDSEYTYVDPPPEEFITTITVE